MSEATPSSEPAPKTRAPKKMKGPVGPYKTEATHFDRGKERAIIVTLDKKVLRFRVQGLKGEATLTIGSAYLKAVSQYAEFSTEARTGKRIHRGNV